MKLMREYYPMVSREEKEKKVIELHNQDKTIRQIAKEVHMSFSQIGQILKENFPEQEIKPTFQQSQYTKALELVDQKKSHFQVAVQLHLTYKEVNKIYKDYLRLRNLDRLSQIYQDLGNGLESFLILHNALIAYGKTPADAILISNHLDELNRATIFMR